MNSISFGIRDNLKTEWTTIHDTLTYDLKVLNYSKVNSKEEHFENTAFYHYKKENITIRFDSAYFLLREQRHRDQRFNHKGNLK